MSGPAEDNGHSEDSGSVLANLPRTRPQRRTARRDASRSRRASDRAAAGAGANGGVAATAAATAAAPAQESEEEPAKTPRTGTSRSSRATAAKAKPRVTAAKRTAPARPRKAAAGRPRKPAPEEEVPRQGFECEDDRATGAVPPPDTADFVGTAVEALGELAKAGISGGERVLRDVLSRLGR